MEFQFALKSADLPVGTMKLVKIADQEILITNFEDKFYAINGICTHLKGPLSKGKLEGKFVTCPWHGAQFDVTTGKCTHEATVLSFKTTPKDEKTFQVKVEGEDILIEL